MKALTQRQILLLHEQLIDETVGSRGLRDEGLLQFALAAPFQEYASFRRIRPFSKRRPGWDTA